MLQNRRLGLPWAVQRLVVVSMNFEAVSFGAADQGVDQGVDEGLIVCRGAEGECGGKAGGADQRGVLLPAGLPPAGP